MAMDDALTAMVDKLLNDGESCSDSSFSESPLVSHKHSQWPSISECITHDQLDTLIDYPSPSECTAKVFDDSERISRGPPSASVFSRKFQDLGKVTTCSTLDNLGPLPDHWLLDSTDQNQSNEPLEEADSYVVPLDWIGKTSVMVRNVPYKCTSEHFHEELRQRGFEGTYDYLYMPSHGGSVTCKGYAFLNFVDAHTAHNFKVSFHGSVMQKLRSKKVLEVLPANLQGLKNNSTHYKITKNARKQAQQTSLRSVVNSELNGRPFMVLGEPAENPQAEEKPAPKKEKEKKKINLSLSNALSQTYCSACGESAPNDFRFCQCCGMQLRAS